MKLPFLWILFKTANMTCLYDEWQMQIINGVCSGVCQCREHSDVLGCPKYVNKAKKGDQVVMSHRGSNAPQENESLHVFMKLPIYLSSKPTLTLTSHLGKNVGLREG